MLRNWKIIVPLLIIIIISYIIVISYVTYHQGGWYCKYCFKGYATDNKDLVIKLHKYDKCEYSVDSMHYFEYYFKRPDKIRY